MVVYSDEHSDTIAEMPLDRINLLIQTWNDRYKELLTRDDISLKEFIKQRKNIAFKVLNHTHKDTDVEFSKCLRKDTGGCIETGKDGKPNPQQHPQKPTTRIETPRGRQAARATEPEVRC